MAGYGVNSDGALFAEISICPIYMCLEHSESSDDCCQVDRISFLLPSSGPPDNILTGLVRTGPSVCGEPAQASACSHPFSILTAICTAVLLPPGIPVSIFIKLSPHDFDGLRLVL